MDCLARKAKNSPEAHVWNPESNEGGHGEAVEAHVASKLTPVSSATTLVVAPFSLEAPI